mmetsp:Transcript_12551/g.26455  ORF Transcript_12551/g.26455 Transcript_12551/m.26455 type:complete len:149 (-) Transcript_12551:382-828(-)
MGSGSPNNAPTVAGTKGGSVTLRCFVAPAQDNIGRYVQDESRERGDPVDTSAWVRSANHRELQVPQQQNYSDCGVFMLTFADFEVRRPYRRAGARARDRMQSGFEIPEVQDSERASEQLEPFWSCTARTFGRRVGLPRTSEQQLSFGV